MTIKLYINRSDKNVLDKNITQVGSDITGTLRDDCSVVDPVIKVEGLAANITGVNYAYIQEFNRYYYINNITCTGPFFELNMHVDVLKTYAQEIRENKAVISRQQNKYNLYIQDGVFKTEAFPHIQVAQFPTGFDSFNFVFTVAG